MSGGVVVAVTEGTDMDMSFQQNFTNGSMQNWFNYTSEIENNTQSTFAQYSITCIKSFVFGSIIIGAVLGNALVILAVRRNRKLR